MEKTTEFQSHSDSNTSSVVVARGKESTVSDNKHYPSSSFHRKLSTNKDIKNTHERDGPLTKNEVQCPVCWSILMQPVTLPCAHSLCLTCYQNTVKEGYLNCPCCRTRISVWSRRAVKTDNLVNVAFWNRIKEQFPQFVTAREEGKDSQDVLADLSCDSTESDSALHLNVTNNTNNNRSQFDGTLSKPGEIATEFQALYKQHEEEIKAKKVLDSKASAELIRKLKADDGFATQQINLDESEDESSGVTNSLPSSAYQGLSSIPKVSTNKKSACSHNSLCRNLFSEWGNDTDSQEISSVKTSGKLTIGSKRNSSHFTPRAVQKRITWPDTLNDSTSFPPQRRKQAKLSGDLNMAGSSSKAVSYIDSICSPPKPSTSQCISVHANASSSFVPVCSPRMDGSEAVKTTFNGSRRLSIDSRLTETKTKLDYIKRSHAHTSSDTPDSINIEVNSHFRPILSAPKTPPKQLPDGSFLPEPRLVKSTPIRLGSASAAIMLTSLSQQIAKIERNTVAKSWSRTNDRGGSFDIDSSVLPSSTRSAEIFSPQPPPLIHYSSQMPVSPDSNDNSTEEGRITEPPPELDLYDGEDDRHEKERQVSELRYRQVQAIQLEQFRQRKLQEEKDRAYAEKLQRELNTSEVTFTRTRGSLERYSIRNWVNSDPQSVEAEPLPSTTVPVKNHSLRTTRNKQQVSKPLPATRFSSNKSTNSSTPKRTRTRKSSSTTATILPNSRVTRSQSLRRQPLQN